MGENEKEPDLTPCVMVGAVVLGAAMFPQIVLPVLAAKAARNYLDIMPFSRSGVIEQLEFEGYTREQAEYGVSQAGL